LTRQPKKLLVDGLSKNRTLRQIPAGQRTQDTNRHHSQIQAGLSGELRGANCLETVYITKWAIHMTG